MMDQFMDAFRSPDASKRGTPFWAWNTRMTEENIDHIIDALEQMGMGGAYMHSRAGLDNVYLSREFFDLIKYTRQKFLEKGMYTCLYDEDRWPSGFAGGYVTADRENRQRFLVYSNVPPEQLVSSGPARAEGVRLSGDRRLLGIYAVTLEDGILKSYRIIDKPSDAQEHEIVRYAWCEVKPPEAYDSVDTLNPAAIRQFLDITYEAYKREVGDGFGKDIPSIFSDEPAFSRMSTLSDPFEDNYVTMPYTDAFEQEYIDTYGESFLKKLPEIFYIQKDGRMSVTSYRYHDLLCEMFCRTYADQIGGWCRDNGLLYTGHMFREDDLEGQTYALGECMRLYRGFSLPGVDVLSDKRRITTVKQVQSACHQLGSKHATCEIYGVTNWTFDFRGHKLAGDWQAALGITHRVHHLTWTSMKGNAKRDYPASIGPQSPWYKEYNLIETYFARVRTMLEQGDPAVRVGVIHPIETYWLYWGPNSQTQEKREDIDKRFLDLTMWLLYGLIDFDYISEGLLKDFAPQPEENRFVSGTHSYDVILVPALETLRSTTVERLKKFAKAGGRVIFLENKPVLVDAIPSGGAADIPGEVIPFSRFDVLKALRPYAEIELIGDAGNRPENLFSQTRADGENKYVFLSHVYPPRNADIPEQEFWNVSTQGQWRVIALDAMNGTSKEIPACVKDGRTFWRISGYAHESWLFMLLPGVPMGMIPDIKHSYAPVSLPNTAALSLEEPDVLVLDKAKVSIDGGKESDVLEIRRADAHVKRTLGIKPGSLQPWRIPKKPADHSVKLVFEFESEIDCTATLALESPEGCTAEMNGIAVDLGKTGYYVDLDIIKAGDVSILKGHNTLTLTKPYGERDMLENLYLLGAFGVKCVGGAAIVTELPKALAFTDSARQNLAFYGGNYTLTMPFELEKDADIRLTASFFRAPLLKAAVDGRDMGVIAFAPYTLDLGRAAAGTHTLTITVFGNRQNTFGALHLTDRSIPWKGPNMWVSTGDAWSDEYQLSETGLLKSPVLEIID